MKAYSLYRPVSTGTYPKDYDVVEIVNFDSREHVDAIQREAWGYVEFVQDVPQDVLDAYELAAKPPVDTRLVCIAQAIARKCDLREGEQFDKLLGKAVSLGYTKEQVVNQLDLLAA